jgi:hypothetical protein
MTKTWSYDDGVAVDCDFPGGNIIVTARDGNLVSLEQDLRDTEGHWFYWSFRVHGAAGKRLRFLFTNGDVIGARGPAVSTDGGSRWFWLGLASVSGHSFTFDFPPGSSSVAFSVTMPYQVSNLARFIDRFRGQSAFRVETLCRSEHGREVPLLQAGRFGGKCTYRLLLTARHHSCESMASWVLEGILASALAGDATGSWFREHVDIAAVPFVDIDGVEEGDQGKNRRPFDHNRDYASQNESIYAAPRALRAFASRWADGTPGVALDLHCPYLKGDGDSETIYFVGGADEGVWRAVQEYSDILEREQRGPLRYAASSNLPFGIGWNNVDSGMLTCSSAWSASLPGFAFGVTLETAYANAHGQEVNPGTARMFGRDLARALWVFFVNRGR